MCYHYTCHLQLDTNNLFELQAGSILKGIARCFESIHIESVLLTRENNEGKMVRNAIHLGVYQQIQC